MWNPVLRTDFTQTPHFNYPNYPVQREILSCSLLSDHIYTQTWNLPLNTHYCRRLLSNFHLTGCLFRILPTAALRLHNIHNLGFIFTESQGNFLVLIRRLIGWLIDWFIYLFIHSLTDWMIDWLIDWLTDWLIDWLTDWLTDWLIDRYSPWERPTEPRPSPTWTSTHPARMRYYVWQLSAWIGQLDIEQQVITSLTALSLPLACILWFVWSYY